MSTFNAGAIEANLTLDRSSWQRDFRKTMEEVERLDDTTITIMVDADTDNAKVQLDNLERELETLENDSIKIEVDAAFEEITRNLDELEARLEELDSKTWTVGVDADTTNAEVQLDNLERNLDMLENDTVTIPIDVDDRTDADLDALNTYLKYLETHTITIPIDVDTAAAETNLIQFLTQVQLLSMNKVEIGVDVDSAMAEAKLVILEQQVDSLDGREIDIDVDSDALTAHVGESTNHLGLLKILIIAIIALAPVLAVAIGAGAAAITAFVGAVVAAAGPLAILAGGMMGIIKRYNDLKEAGGPMGPSMQRFADAIELVKDAWDSFLDVIQPHAFDLMARGMELVADILPALAPIFKEAATMMNFMLKGIEDFVQSGDFKEMIGFFKNFGVDMLKRFIQIIGNLLVFFGHLFDAIQPLAREMMRGLRTMTAGWAEWSKTLDDNDSFQAWMDAARTYGPMVLDMLGSLLQALIAVGKALVPFAGPMLKGLIWLFDLIANAPTEVLTVLIGGAVGLWAALKFGIPILQGLNTAFTILRVGLMFLLSPVGLVIAAIVALVAVFVWWRSRASDAAGGGNMLMAAFAAIIPVVQAVVGFIRDNWPAVLAVIMSVVAAAVPMVRQGFLLIQTIIRTVVSVVTFIWQHFGTYIVEYLRAALNMVIGVVRGAFRIVQGIFQVIRGILTGNWRAVWEGIRNITGGAIDAVVAILRGLIGMGRAIFGAIGSAIRSIWNGVWSWATQRVSSFATGLGAIWNRIVGAVRDLGSRIAGAARGMWDGITSGFRNAINAVIGWWNGLQMSVDIPDRIPGLPDSFSIGTPNLPMLAQGAWIDEPTLAVVGEGNEPEIVTPESKMREIVANYSSNIDYGRMASAIAAALESLFSRVGGAGLGGMSRDELLEALQSAGANIKVDATMDQGSIVAAIVNGVGFELRRLGFGGKANV